MAELGGGVGPGASIAGSLSVRAVRTVIALSAGFAGGRSVSLQVVASHFAAVDLLVLSQFSVGAGKRCLALHAFEPALFRVPSSLAVVEVGVLGYTGRRAVLSAGADELCVMLGRRVVAR